MRFGRARRKRPSIDISPLIDVVFQLLLFYAVTTQFVSDERLKLELPEAKTAEQHVAERPKIAEVLITEDGKVLVGDRIVAEDDLEFEIRRLVNSTADQALTIRGDRGADYGTVIHVLDIAREVGAKAINMSAIKPPTPTP
jgi:biopolymer transport protein ExbD